MKELRLDKGYNIPLAGAAEPGIVETVQARSVGIRPGDIRGVIPKLVVGEGETVVAGQVLFHDKNLAEIQIVAPVSGLVRQIIRGEKRHLEEIIIVPDQEQEIRHFSPINRLSLPSRKEIIDQLCAMGLFPLIRQRPFAIVANPRIVPRDIFINAMDTAPLAANPNELIKGCRADFQFGIDVLRLCTEGDIYLSIDGSKEDITEAFIKADEVILTKIKGPHPAGTIGVQIHHLRPIRDKEVVWYLNARDVATIGRSMTVGYYSNERIVAVVGPAALRRGYFRTIQGCSIETLTGMSEESSHYRFISGDVLTGRKIRQNGHIGFYDSTVTVIGEASGTKILGWLTPGAKQVSFSRTFLSALHGKTIENGDSALNGARRNFILTGQYEKVLPMNIQLQFILRAIIAGDLEEMEELGLGELAEEEVALCEYVCASKVEVQKIVRKGLDLLAGHTS